MSARAPSSRRPTAPAPTARSRSTPPARGPTRSPTPPPTCRRWPKARASAKPSSSPPTTARRPASPSPSTAPTTRRWSRRPASTPSKKARAVGLGLAVPSDIDNGSVLDDHRQRPADDRPGATGQRHGRGQRRHAHRRATRRPALPAAHRLRRRRTRRHVRLHASATASPPSTAARRSPSAQSTTVRWRSTQPPAASKTRSIRIEVMLAGSDVDGTVVSYTSMTARPPTKTRCSMPPCPPPPMQTARSPATRWSAASAAAR